MVYGDFLDRTSCPWKPGMEDDRTFLSSHVSHLRHGSLYRPCIPSFKKVSPLIRGSLYMLGIFAAELGTGMFLKHFHMCPWDYSNTPYHYKGVIRLDYAPVWFFTGLFYEKILSLKE